MALRAFVRRLTWLFRRGDFAEELNEEMRLHVDLRARRLREQGIAEGEARYMAMRQFGNRTQILDRASEKWGWNTCERLLQDLRLGARTLRKTPGFTAIAVLTLAAGLGINTAIFSVVNAVMVRSLPYAQPARLVSLWEEANRQRLAIANTRGGGVGLSGGSNRTTVAVANLVDYRAQSRSFAGLASYDRAPMNLTGNGKPERVVGEAVSAGFFDVLAASPAMGRGIQPEDDREDAAPVVILTHQFWERRLGADPGVLGRSLMLDGRPRQVVGVLPRGFQAPSEFALPDRPEFFVPAGYPKELLVSHGDHEVNVVARLAPGVSVATAQADLDRLSANLAAQYPRSNTGMRAVIAPLQEDLVRGLRDSLWALLGASGFIVLITCVNVANLLLVRSAARRHESSVRLALGASRFRMIRQFLSESVLLAALGCAAGVLLGYALMRVLISLAPANIPQLQSVGMDWRVFAVCAAVATFSGLLFGIAPAWQASEARPVEALRAATRTTGGRAQVRWRASLTVAEVALSLILTIGAGLLLKSFVRFMGVDLGFQPDRVLAMNVNLPNLRYANAQQRLQFFEAVEARVAALPGVQSVAFANRMPLRGGWGSSVELDATPGTQHDSDFQAVSPGYFATLGIPLLRGRLPAGADRDGAPFVAVVNQAFARQYLDGADPIGKRLRRSGAPWVEIVGVVNDIRRGGKSDSIKPQVYLCAAQTKLYPVALADLAVRTGGEPRRLVNAIQDEIWAIDKDQPITNVRTMEEIVSATSAMRRFQTLLLAVFAAVALGLALIGIFGVLSYAVSQRRSELGIRMALGAAPRDILALVLKQAGRWIGLGVAIGVAGSVAVTRYLASLLFDVRATDWQSYAAAVVLLTLLALAAALIPASRGAKSDPIAALRGE
jgi:putative ABC transport system permease protein